MSLTRTLALIVTSNVFVILLFAALWSYYESNHELDELFDAELAQSSRIVEGLVRYLAGIQSQGELSRTLEQTLQLPEDLMQQGRRFGVILPDGAGHLYEKKLAFEVWSPAGERLLDTLDASDSQNLQAGFSWVESAGYRWRTFTMQDVETGYWIRTGQREDIRQELSRNLAIGNLLPLLLSLPLLALAIIAGIRWGFRPLRRLEASVRTMDPIKIHTLDPREAPREVSGLVDAVNRLLQRIDQTMERERRFSADAAHELRTPLAALRLNLERIRKPVPGNEDSLISAVDRMSHLVDQMVMLSRVDAGMDFEPEYQSLEQIVEQSIADVTPLALQKRIEPTLENRAGAALCRCQAALISTLMRSVLANAIQYSPQGTEVNTTIDSEQGGYRIRICDQGPGIPGTERERALDRFSRLDQRLGTGAGLGLTIASRIVELHGGLLELEDRADGQPGLCVTVWLRADTLQK
jgi:two-component system sensor histidine kinase QseC